MKVSAISALAAAMGVAAPAQAEFTLDAFAGKGFPESRRASIRADEAVVNGIAVPAALRIGVDRLKATNSTTYGARLGYWSGAFGIALDAATLDPDVRRQTVRATGDLRLDESLFGERIVIDPGSQISVSIPHVTVPTTASIAALAMLRLPRGRARPYAFAGPTYVVTDRDLSGDWGLRAGGGLRVAVTRWLGLFGEYRYTRVNASAVAGRIGSEIAGVDADSGDIRVDVRLRNHAVVGGIGLQF